MKTNPQTPKPDVRHYSVEQATRRAERLLKVVKLDAPATLTADVLELLVHTLLQDPEMKAAYQRAVEIRAHIDSGLCKGIRGGYGNEKLCPNRRTTDATLCPACVATSDAEFEQGERRMQEELSYKTSH